LLAQLPDVDLDWVTAPQPVLDASVVKTTDGFSCDITLKDSPMLLIHQQIPAFAPVVRNVEWSKLPLFSLSALTLHVSRAR